MNEVLEEKTPVKNQESKIYSYNEAIAASLTYFNGDELPAKAFVDKYAMRDLDNNIYELTPDSMHKRMAKEFGRMEDKFQVNLNGKSKTLSKYGQEREHLSEEKIYGLFKDFKYVVPQGSVMAILGNEFVIGSLSNCIVLPEIFDSYGGIMFSDQQLVQLQKRRCGTGLDLSSLRPENAPVTNAAGSSTGLVSFMDRFSNTTREVAQNGRRGATMLTCDITHPDVEKFITIKQDLSKVTGANISVRLSDEFMQAVSDDKEFTLRWPIESSNPKYSKTIKAKDLWNTVIKCAHNTAEPGLIFWDRQHKYSTSSVYPGFKNVSTNPCSEIAMQGGDSCRLIAINLFGFVIEPFTKNADFDYDNFYKATYESQRLMDDLVELELEHIDQIFKKIDSDPEPDHIKQVERKTWETLYESGKKGRRTGLGFTALADTIAALGYKFDGNKSLEIVDKIMRTKMKAEFDSSIDMAIERGTFTGFSTAIEKTSEFVQMMEKEFPEIYERMMTYGRRNISISTVAPTGTLSILTQTSSGIEPVFLLSYKRRKKITHNDKNARVDFTDAMGDKWQEFPVYHPKLKMWMDVTGKTDESESPWFGATAQEIDWGKRVKMQSVIQKYTTHSISSTINLANDVTVEKVGEIYMRSWEMGLKGITVYRDGSRSGVLISNDEKKEKKAPGTENHAPKRPKVLDCDVIRFMNKGEKWIGFVGLYENHPYEIFTGFADDMKIPTAVEKGKVVKSKTDKGSKYDFVYIDKDGKEIVEEWLNKTFDKHYWNTAKMISGILRHGMPLPYVVDLVTSLNLDGDVITTWKNGVARMIKRYIPDGTAASDKTCKDCGSESVIYQEGCLLCTSCGSSKCSS